MSTCQNCAYYSAQNVAPATPPSLDPSSPTPIVGDTIGSGECRIHAPAPDGYPKVSANDWCGEIVIVRR